MHHSTKYGKLQRSIVQRFLLHSRFFMTTYCQIETLAWNEIDKLLEGMYIHTEDLSSQTSSQGLTF